MNKISILLLCSSLLSACNSTSDEDDKHGYSAIIESRQEPTQEELLADTKVVMLGTGTPIPDRYRAGSSIAVIHKGETYLFDIGAGSVHNATKARYAHNIPSLYPSQICCVFLTHMHSDHIVDFVELAQTLWWRRRANLRAWGPEGLNRMVKGMYEMMKPDIDIRTSGNQPVPNPEAYKIISNEIQEGVILSENGLKIEAFLVNHGDIKPAFGYKITTDSKTIVISGDTAYSEKVLEMSKGVDLLFHEVISAAGLQKLTKFWQNYHKSSHTLSTDLGKLAAAAKPKKLVLYHGLFYGTEEKKIIDEVKEFFDGEVVLANDLDIF